VSEDRDERLARLAAMVRFELPPFDRNWSASIGC
jgi:hypothetical protein